MQSSSYYFIYALKPPVNWDISAVLSRQTPDDWESIPGRGRNFLYLPLAYMRSGAYQASQTRVLGFLNEWSYTSTSCYFTAL